MSKESVQGLALRQRRGVIGDWLIGAFVGGLIVLLIGGVAATGGLGAAEESSRNDTVAFTPADVVQQHTALYCGDVPPPVPTKAAAPTC